MPLGLLALAIGGFGIGLTEFVIMGLLPEVAADFGVTESVAGWLISGYALSVAVGAIGLTSAVTRFNRKHVLIGLMALFIIGNLLSALAPGYAVMMTGRIVAALSHGAFFGIGSVVAADMVAGNLIGGKTADRSLSGTLTIGLLALTAVLSVFALTAHSQVMTVISLILMGGFGFATVPGLQMRIMRYAGRAETLASGANIAAFNIGNALGAWLGGLTIAAGLGYTSSIWAGAALTLAGLAVFVVATRLATRPTQQAPARELAGTPA
jgi:predicted MFS family arabinose efflux permease